MVMDRIASFVIIAGAGAVVHNYPTVLSLRPAILAMELGAPPIAKGSFLLKEAGHLWVPLIF